MKVDRVVLRRVRLPLVEPFRTPHGMEAERDILIVEVSGPDTAGWGECVAMAEPLYNPEYVDGAHAVMRAHLLPRLLARGPVVAAEQVAGLLAQVKGHAMAKAALEMAILDGDLRQSGRSLASYFGAVRASVPAGVSVGIMASIPALIDAVASFLDQGYVRVKLKIQPGWDVEPLAAVRATFGPDVPLQVDANGSYSRGDVDLLRRLDDFRLLLIEQPLPEDDLSGHAEVARRVKTPICLDESVVTESVAMEALERGACSVINIKAGRLGGYLAAKRLHDACYERGVPVWCGGMLESGLGRAANTALAALPGFTLPGDLSASERYFAHDLTEPFVLDEGHLHVPDKAGIGVEPDLVFLDGATTTREEFRADR